ncbi:phage prohead protease, HK97 family [Phyllobacterium sp. YR531]|nr:phage prohead protease, HK97 family [Phyllobacterium sp. YR531]
MSVSLEPTRRTIAGIEKKFAGLTIENVTADGSFTGYASLFDEVDLGKDAIKAGAFLKSVRERGPGGIRMLWQHDPNQPIGVWTEVREDKRGLYVEGKLAKGVAKAQEVLELMRSGAIDGLSIGFKTVRAKADGAGVRHIHEADLWEISVVTFPMLPSARVGQVKSQPRALKIQTLEHPPQLLWNIKANELLLGALKRASPTDYNRRWINSLEAENAELKRRSNNFELFQLWLSHKFDPNQPRVSAGNTNGGQWTDGGGNSGQSTARTRPITSRGGRFAGAVPAPKPQGAAPKAPDGTPVQLAQTGGGRRGGVPNVRRYSGGQFQELRPDQVLRLDLAIQRAKEAVRQVQLRDTNWRPQARVYNSVESEISANESIRSDAAARMRELSQGAVVRGQFIPYGFVDAAQCTQFGSTIRNGLTSIGVRDAQIVLRGSAVTGRNSLRDSLFDQGFKPSDFDIAIISRTLMQRAQRQGNIGLRGRRTRTAPIEEPPELRSMDLLKLRNDLNDQTGRKLGFVIFESRQAMVNRQSPFAVLDGNGNFIRYESGE